MLEVPEVGLKSIVVRALTPVLRRAGYSTLRSWELADLRDKVAKVHLVASGLPELLSHVLGRIHCDCILDVGANRGQFHDLLRTQAKFTGHIVSYEPVPELAKALAERTRSENMWEVQSGALGPSAGEMELNVMAADEFSSFLAPRLGQPNRFGATNRVVRRVVVPVTTLGSEIERIHRERGLTRFYVKLDTQGYDLDVLRGVGAGLERIVGLQSEVSLVPIYDGMPDWFQSIKAMQELGFQVAGLFPVSNDVATCRAVEVDCILVRPEAVCPLV